MSKFVEINPNKKYSRELPEKIKDKLSITQALKHYGGCYGPQEKGCPFHDSKNKNSLAIQDGLVWCACPGCKLNKQGGDIFNVIAIGENLDIKNDFKVILKKACEIAGIDFKENMVTENGRERVVSEALHLFFDYTKKYIKEIEPYILTKRNLNKEELSKLNLGYLPTNHYMKFRNILANILPETKKVFSKDGKTFLHSAFYNFVGRIIHPHYFKGRLIYLTGEITPNSTTSKAKYVKLRADFSPNNRAELYLLDNITDGEELIILEGYWDALKMSLMKKKVITYGTCKVPNEFASRYSHILKQKKKIIICFDTEENMSGIEGAISVGMNMIQAGVSPNNLFIAELITEGGKVDIDMFIKDTTDGVTKLKVDLLLSNAEPFEMFRSRHNSEYAVMEFPTKHLPLFKEFSEVMSLVGDENKIILKAIYLSNIGNILKNVPLKLGSICVDTRINPLIILPSGMGKSIIKQGIKEMSCGKEVSEVVSLHPEQLVGKMVKVGKGKNTEMKPSYGYLSHDTLIFDEGRKFLVDSNKELNMTEFRSYICLALDVFGRNWVVKRLVDSMDSPLKYLAKCRIIIFSQPGKFNEDILITGFLRRFMVIPITPSAADYYKERVNWIQPYAQKNIIKDFYSTIERKFAEGEWSFQDGVKEELVVYSKLVKDFGLAFSELGAKYTMMTYREHLMDLLLKIAAIHSVLMGSKEISKDAVELAYIDLIELFKYNLMALEKYAKGTLHLGDFSSDEVAVIGFLKEKGAINQELSVIGKMELARWFGDKVNISKNGAWKRLNKLLENGVISNEGNVCWVERKILTKYNEVIVKQPSKLPWYKKYLQIIKIKRLGDDDK